MNDHAFADGDGSLGLLGKSERYEFITGTL
jgi:hypothetical protein